MHFDGSDRLALEPATPVAETALAKVMVGPLQGPTTFHLSSSCQMQYVKHCLITLYYCHQWLKCQDPDLYNVRLDNSRLTQKRLTCTVYLRPYALL